MMSTEEKMMKKPAKSFISSVHCRTLLRLKLYCINIYIDKDE